MLSLARHARGQSRLVDKHSDSVLDLQLGDQNQSYIADQLLHIPQILNFRKGEVKVRFSAGNVNGRIESCFSALQTDLSDSPHALPYNAHADLPLRVPVHLSLGGMPAKTAM